MTARGRVLSVSAAGAGRRRQARRIRKTIGADRYSAGHRAPAVAVQITGIRRGDVNLLMGG
jgi:hypothetical protein